MNRKQKEIRSIARSLALSRARAIAQDNINILFEKHQYGLNSRTTLTMTGITSSLIDQIIIFRDRQLAHDPHMPIDLVNQSIIIAAHAVSHVLTKACSLAQESETYQNAKAATAMAPDITDDEFIEAIKKLNQQSQEGSD